MRHRRRRSDDPRPARPRGRGDPGLQSRKFKRATLDSRFRGNERSERVSSLPSTEVIPASRLRALKSWRRRAMLQVNDAAVNDAAPPDIIRERHFQNESRITRPMSSLKERTEISAVAAPLTKKEIHRVFYGLMLGGFLSAVN